MSKYQELKDALKAGPTEGKWNVEDGHDMPPHRWSVWAACGRFICGFAEMIDGAREQQKADIRYIAAANPATISALLADLEAAVSLIEGVLMIDRGASGRIIIEGWQEETIRAALSQLKGD